MYIFAILFWWEGGNYAQLTNFLFPCLSCSPLYEQDIIQALICRSIPLSATEPTLKNLIGEI